MKTLALALPILAVVATAPQGCNQQQTLNYAIVATTAGCIVADTVTGVAIDVTTIKLPKGADPAASKTLARWQNGQAISTLECNRMAQALGRLQGPLP